MKAVRIAIVNPDGSEEIVDLPTNTTNRVTVVAPFAASHDRFTVRGEVHVVIRRVR